METTIANIKQFILAGHAIFTLENDINGNHFTYKINTPKDFDESNPRWFVSVMTGPDNMTSYDYAGMISSRGFSRTAATKMSEEALSFALFVWFYRCVELGVELPKFVKFYHAGRCGRCGRVLTTPASIESGFGPECINRLSE